MQGVPVQSRVVELRSHMPQIKKPKHKTEAIKTLKMVHVKKIHIKKKRQSVTLRVFPGGLGVRTQCFHCLGQGSIPGQGTKILITVQCAQKKKKRKKRKND